MLKWLKKKCNEVVDKFKSVNVGVAFKRFLAVPLLAVIGYDIHAMAVAPSVGHFMALSIDLVLVAWWYEWLNGQGKTVFDIELLGKSKLCRILMVLLFILALPSLLILIFVTWFIMEFVPDTYRDFKDMAKDTLYYIKTGDK
ncbi:HAMP domain-containing protein [Vibrio phage vB_VpP_DE10]|uniref:HAMP domain-containing protein n=1 Tax=Vibrio phage vB_VpP_DE10 TaxID=2861001 RepID=A0AAE8ATQ3_9CAUD|nr:HAMP domain-containing protein [Vibrio phage vB_VpP_DE10]